MGTKLLMFTAFHPQMDGATERANRSIAQILQTVVDNDQTNWSEKCSMAEFAINSSVNATTGYAPLELNYGYMPRSGQHISTSTTFKGVKQWCYSLSKHIYSDAKEAKQESGASEIGHRRPVHICVGTCQSLM